MSEGVVGGGARILVLGGTGFIGKAVVARLLGERDMVVRVAARRERTRPDDAGAQFVRCDLRDPISVATALAGVDIVINCWRERNGEQESARCIENLLRAIEATNVRHLIHLSSIAVYGAAAGMIDEDTPPLAPLNWYARAKSSAEQSCRHHASGRLAVTILRPALVYGPGGEEWSLDFMRSIRRGHLDRLGPAGEGWANLVHVDDLADFCVCLARRPARGVTVFNVAGASPVTFNAYFAGITEALRAAGVAISPRAATLPLAGHARPALRHGVELIRRAIGRFVPPADRGLAAIQHRLRRRPEERIGMRYAGRTRYLPDRAIAAGFAGTTPIAEGTRRSVEWAIAAGVFQRAAR